MIRDREEGIVTKIIDERLVEVTIEEGFAIPVLRSELAIVSKDESQYFGAKKSEEAPGHKSLEEQKKIISGRGLFIGFEQLNNTQFILYLINNTDFDCPFTVTENLGKNRRGVASGECKSKSYSKISSLELDKIESWPEFEFSILFSREGHFEFQAPYLKNFKFRSKRFFREAMQLPILNTKGYFFQIDAKSTEIDVEELKEHLNENVSRGFIDMEVKKALPLEIDLHFEVLKKEAPELDEEEILPYQIDYFEKMLDRAIASGMDHITFIHGVGNGKLKLEIHRLLSRNEQIRSFKDAHKEKFGYGATMVLIK